MCKVQCKDAKHTELYIIQILVPKRGKGKGREGGGGVCGVCVVFTLKITVC